MNSSLLKYGYLLILLPILQVSIFNNVNLLGYINPYFYIIFIFIFPINKDKTILLLSSFFLGIFIDTLTNDGGIHTFSIVFIAYFRLFVLRVLSNKNDYDIEQLNTRDIDFPILFLWISILTFTHHFLVFSLEQFSFLKFSTLLLKTFLTSILSIVLIIFGLQLFLKKKSNA
jgi:hypothetical protein